MNEVDILEGRQPPTLELEGLLKQFPIEWDQQLATSATLPIAMSSSAT
jgi:hypothetical protein